MPQELALLAVAVGFAASIGAHYTGACMGMPYALGVVSRRWALRLMAPAAWVGATVASHAVERTVGRGLLLGRLPIGDAVIVVALGLALTTAFTRARVPTSTIQLLVFSLVGVGLGSGLAVRWTTMAELAAVWVAAPAAALALGYVAARALDRSPVGRAGPPPRGGSEPGAASAGRIGAAALLAVGMAASFVMGANDVANATGMVVGTGVLGALAAGAVGGAGLAVGVIVWGGRLLERVAFEIVTVDRVMATAAQLVQAAVVLAAVSVGFFTSLNQALVGAMAGASLARGRATVHGRVLRGIVLGWALGPVSALGLGVAAAQLAGRLAGGHAAG